MCPWALFFFSPLFQKRSLIKISLPVRVSMRARALPYFYYIPSFFSFDPPFSTGKKKKSWITHKQFLFKKCSRFSLPSFLPLPTCTLLLVRSILYTSARWGKREWEGSVCQYVARRSLQDNFDPLIHKFLGFVVSRILVSFITS